MINNYVGVAVFASLSQAGTCTNGHKKKIKRPHKALTRTTKKKGERKPAKTSAKREDPLLPPSPLTAQISNPGGEDAGAREWGGKSGRGS